MQKYVTEIFSKGTAIVTDTLIRQAIRIKYAQTITVSQNISTYRNSRILACKRI